MADNQTPLDILLGRKPAKKPEPAPIEKARAKAYAPNPLVKVIAKNEAKKKAAAEASYNAELKRKRTAVKQVPVWTKYGTATVPQAGYEAMSPEDQKSWLDATRKEIEATVDAQQKKDGGVVAQPTFNPYDSKPVTEKDAYVDIANAYLGVQPVMETVNAVAKTDTGKAISGGAKNLSKSMTFKSDNPADQFVLDVTANAPAQFVESFGNIFDANVDNIGKFQSVAELTASAIPAGQSVKAGKAVFDASRKAGVPLIKALAKGVGKAAVENFDIGLGAIKGGSKKLSDTLVRTGNRMTDALSVPQGVRERLIPRTNQLPFTPKPALLERNPVAPGQAIAPAVVQPSAVKATDSFENQQMAAIRDVMGADDVSGVVPDARESLKAKSLDFDNPESFIESQRTPVADYVGTSHRAPYRNDYNAPAHDVSGMFPADIYTSPKAHQLYGYNSTPEGIAMDKKAIQVIRKLFGNPDAEVEIFRAVPTDKPDTFNAGDWVTTTREYADEHGISNLNGDYKIISKKVNADELFTDANSIHEFGYDPRPLHSDDELRSIYTEARSTSPTARENLTVPNGSNIEPEQPLQPQPVAPKSMADMVPGKPVVAPAKDRPVTGISNAANLSDFEQGIIKSAPKGEGRSVKDILEANKDRKDWDDIADRINKGESYTADTAATVLLGKADYTAKVKSAKDAIERGIVEGASPEAMNALRNSLDDAIENATNYAEKVQRGSSDWSDVGRTLATMLNYNTREIESVLQEARILKGSKLTQADIDLHTAQVKELTDLLESSKAEIARLMKEHAENATKVAAARKIVKTPEARAAKRKQALDEFMAASSGLNAYVNPAVLKQFAKYMYTLIEDGARSVDDVIAAAAKDGVKADYEDVYAAMRTRVKESTLSDLQKEIAKTKRDLMAAAKADTPEAKAAAGLKLRNKEEIAAWKKSESAKAKEEAEILRNLKADSGGLTKEQRAARQKELDAALGENAKADNIRQQIVKLLKQAEDGSLPAPKRREISDEIKALEAERQKALKAARDASPEYQSHLLEKDKERLREKLKGLEDRIANKDYAEVSIVKNARRTDDELDKLRQKIRVREQIVKAGVESMRPRTGADKVGHYLNEIKLWNAASRVKDFTANAVRGVDFAVSSLPRRAVDLATAKSLGEIPITKGTNAERTARVFGKSKNRLKADAELILKGADPDSVKKYGSMGIGGKAAGLTDVPFKSFYYEWMADAAADVKARKKLGNGASPEAIATEREAILANLDEHPDIQLMAEEYSLNQTLNNGNWASETVGFWRKKAGKTGAVAVDEFIGRFAKVITNVAIDATDRAGVGAIRGGLKIRNAKKLGKTLTTSERAIINDMITKGFTGLASVTLGYYMGDKVVGTIKGERSKYIDFGDAESIGGPMSAFLLGATIRKAESIEDPNEAMGLRMRTAMNLPMNTPLASNAKDVLELLSEADEKTVSKYVARKAVGLIPIASQSRDIAERMDTKYGIKTGAEVERDKMPKEISTKTGKEIQTSNFLKILEADFKSRTPGLRQSLPVKQTAEDKKKAKEAAEAKKVQWLR